MTSKRSGKSVKSHWSPLIDGMDKQGCVGNELTLQCRRHGAKSTVSVASNEELEEILRNPRRLCDRKCGELYPCLREDHSCKQTCVPYHEAHVQCQELVLETFEPCGHPMRRQCHQDKTKLKCKTTVNCELKKCGHTVNKACYKKPEDVICSENCKQLMDCNLHRCPEKCGLSHDHKKCGETVRFAYSGCGHNDTKKCYQSTDDKKCLKLVDYEFPGCGHPSPSKKVCSESIGKYECEAKVPFKHSRYMYSKVSI